MAVPSFFEFIHPLLQYLDEHPEGVKAADAHDAVAHRVRLSDEDCAETLPRSVSDSIVLVDGHRLTQLMIDHAVGVTHKPINVPEVDSDYFEEG